MAKAQTNDPTARKPLRLWPGVVAAALVLLARYVVPIFVPDALMYGVLGGVVGGLAVVLWWVFLSRAPWSERLGAVAVMIIGAVAIKPVLHPSIAMGMMGMMFFVYAIPSVLGPAFVAWAAATRHLSGGLRWASMVATVFLACGVWTLLRTDGIKGEGGAQLAWRWTKTPEQRLLGQAADEPPTLPPAPAAAEIPKETGAAAPDPRVESPALPAAPAAAKTAPAYPVPEGTGGDWPGFRGPDRDGIIRGVRIETDWSKSPPVRLWRRPVGPGWSSFAVRGNLLYTQEQRGDHEVVSSYNLTTGVPVWRHREAARFWESNGGAGPRATPTLSNGRVYTLGATGIVNALDARNGAVVWSRNAASDTGAKVPGWGFSSSPLVVGDVVVVYAGAFVAYDQATGNPRWVGKVRRGSYSSPHLATIDGAAQIVQLTGAGATSVAPADGATLWEHSWEGGSIVQPALTADGDVLITNSDMMGGVGIRRIAVTHGPGGWSVEERWTSRGLKPYFNDYVLHKGHAFGFDGNILACIDIEGGTRKWKGGRYGNGQLVLLPDQDLLLVLSEDGELALVDASPDKFAEVARFPALDGKTWNHPVLVGDVLLVRNGQEMTAFRLTLAGR